MVEFTSCLLNELVSGYIEPTGFASLLVVCDCDCVYVLFFLPLRRGLLGDVAGDGSSLVNSIFL